MCKSVRSAKQCSLMTSRVDLGEERALSGKGVLESMLLYFVLPFFHPLWLTIVTG